MLDIHCSWWLMYIWDIVTCSFLDSLKAEFHSPGVGFIKKSLLNMPSFQRCCHPIWKNLLILGSKSLYGISTLSGPISKADLAVESAFLFLSILMWLGIHHIRITFESDTEFNQGLNNKEIFKLFLRWWSSVSNKCTCLNRIHKQLPIRNK